MAPAVEPFPLYGKMRLSEMGFEHGSLDGARLRTRIARLITAQVEKPTGSDSLYVHGKSESLPADLDVLSGTESNDMTRKRKREASLISSGDENEKRKPKTD